MVDHFTGGVTYVDLDSLLGSDQEAWYRRCDTELGNFRAALRWSIDARHGDLALRLAAALWQFWRRTGDFSEGRGWLHEALAMPAGDAVSRGRALWGAAWLAYHQADYEESRSLGGVLRSLAESGEDRLALRNALTIAGMVAMSQGRYTEAIEAHAEAVAKRDGTQVTPCWVLSRTSGRRGFRRPPGRPPTRRLP